MFEHFYKNLLKFYNLFYDRTKNRHLMEPSYTFIFITETVSVLLELGVEPQKTVEHRALRLIDYKSRVSEYMRY
jgi:hypothetical protein